MDGKVSLISPDDFLAELVPAAETPMLSNFDTTLSSLKKETSEVNVCDILTNALNRAGDLCPGFTFVATSTTEDKSAKSNQAASCGLYLADFAPKATYDQEKNLVTPAVDWSRIQVSIEVTSEDAFDDRRSKEPSSGVSTSETRREALSQILSHAQSVFNHQQRTAHFMVLIIGEDARILRIDRSGIFGTTAFNYKTDGECLLDFFWRFARLTPAERGEDPTAERVEHDSPYREMMKKKAGTAPQDYVRDMFEASLDEDWPWWLLRLTDERDVGEKLRHRRFLVGRPHFAASGLDGRGSRAYVALDVDRPNAPLVHLKDSWRIVHDEITKEGLVLDRLNAEGVPNVPTLECHGDLLGQTTTSLDLWRKYNPDLPSDAVCPLTTYSHYRLVVKEVGKPLADFRNGYELVRALYCCIRAHARAYKIGLIHSDISAGNILLYSDGKGRWDGLLNDWELSTYVRSDVTSVGQEHERTVHGTWQFQSAQALTDVKKAITLPDELESIFHVLLYMSMRFLPHNYARKDTGRFLHRFFDDFDTADTGLICGGTKMLCMTSGRLVFVQQNARQELHFLAKEGSDYRHPVDGIIYTLLSWFKSYYAVHYVQGVRGQPEGTEEEELISPPFDELLEEDEWVVPAPKARSGAKASDGSPSASTASPNLVGRHIWTDEEETLNLESHDAMAQLFQTVLAEHGWPEADKGEDKLLKSGCTPQGGTESTSR